MGVGDCAVRRDEVSLRGRRERAKLFVDAESRGN